MAGTKVGKAVGHEGNRKKVCAPCGRKILGKDKRILNNVQITSIKENIDADFDILNSAYPVGICQRCRKLFIKISKDPTKKSLFPKLKNYKDLILLKTTRLAKKCSCYICLTGSDTTRKPVYKKETYDGNIEEGHGLVGFAENKLLPAINTKKEKKVMNVCCKCKQEVSRRKSHKCHISLASTHIL